VGVWYPTDAPASARRLDKFTQAVAGPGAPMSGRRHALVVISHGSGGWYGGHYDLALKLAHAGFIVAGVTHRGDSYDAHSQTAAIRAPPAAEGIHDPRIKAAAVAAPALGFAFGRAGLKDIHIPVQLWRAEFDHILPHPDYAEAVRIALPQPPEFHIVAGADHYD